MNTHNGDQIPSSSFEHEPGHFDVLAVPQVPDIGYYNPRLEDVKPTHEILSLVWVPDSLDEAKPVPSEKPGPLAPTADKQAWVASKFPPHAPTRVPFEGYNPTQHREATLARDPNHLRDDFEWVTVVTDDSLYLGLNDAEFNDLSEALRPEHLVVLGQALRPKQPGTTILRSAYSLLGLFGVDESGQLQR